MESNYIIGSNEPFFKRGMIECITPLFITLDEKKEQCFSLDRNHIVTINRVIDLRLWKN